MDWNILIPALIAVIAPILTVLVARSRLRADTASTLTGKALEMVERLEGQVERLEQRVSQLENQLDESEKERVKLLWENSQLLIEVSRLTRGASRLVKQLREAGLWPSWMPNPDKDELQPGMAAPLGGAGE